MKKNNFEIIKNFSIEKLDAYLKSTKKEKNASLVQDFKIDIKSIQCANDEDANTAIEHLTTTIVLMQKAWCASGKESMRLSMLLAYLKTQIVHLESLKRMGASAIFPEDILTVPTGKQSGLKNKIKTKFKSVLNLPNEDNNSAYVFKNNKDDEVITPIQKDYGEIDLHHLDKILNQTAFLSIIHVTAGKHNPFGHSILQLGDQGFLHVNTLDGRPQFMTQEQFSIYLRQNQIQVAAIQHLPILDIDKAKGTIKELSTKQWFWRITHHNCLSFAQAIAIAGGVSYSELGCDHDTAKLPIFFYAAKLNSCSYVNPIYFDEKLFKQINTNMSEQFMKYYQEEAKGVYNLSDDQALLYARYREKDGLSEKMAYATAVFYGDRDVKKFFSAIGEIKNVVDTVKAFGSIFQTRNMDCFKPNEVSANDENVLHTKIYNRH